MDIAEAIEQLSNNNLRPRRMGIGKDASISCVLERPVIKADGQVDLKEWSDAGLIRADAFAVYYTDNCWVASVSTPNPDGVRIAQSEHLANVIDAVCEFYKQRQTTPNDGLMVEDAVRLLKDGNLEATIFSKNVLVVKSQQAIPGVSNLMLENLIIMRHAEGWFGAYCIEGENFCRTISFSPALGDVVRHILVFMRNWQKGHIPSL